MTEDIKWESELLGPITLGWYNFLTVLLERPLNQE